jgi:hypothetical protein
MYKPQWGEDIQFTDGLHCSSYFLNPLLPEHITYKCKVDQFISDKCTVDLFITLKYKVDQLIFDICKSVSYLRQKLISKHPQHI